MTLNEFRTRVLCKLGYVKVRAKKHETWQLKSKKGKIWGRTTVSHGNDEVGKSLIRKFMQQLEITDKNDFDLIYQCTMSREAYYKKLFDTDKLPDA